MTNEQRTELGALAGRAISTQKVADEALQARDAYMIELSDAGIGDGEIGRCIPGDDPNGNMHRVTVNRIVNNYRKRLLMAQQQREQG